MGLSKARLESGPKPNPHPCPKWKRPWATQGGLVNNQCKRSTRSARGARSTSMQGRISRCNQPSTPLRFTGRFLHRLPLPLTLTLPRLPPNWAQPPLHETNVISTSKGTRGIFVTIYPSGIIADDARGHTFRHRLRQSVQIYF